MEKIKSINKKAIKLFQIRDTIPCVAEGINLPSREKKDKGHTFDKPLTEIEIKNKRSQQKGEGRAKIRLEQLKNKFINLLMRSGEKSKAHKLFAFSLNILQQKAVSSKNVSNLSIPSKNENDMRDIREYSPLCENSTQLFQFYTEKNNKVGTFLQEPQKAYKKQETLSWYPFFDKDEKKEYIEKDPKFKRDTKTKPSIPSYKGYAEQNYYNNFLKNSTLYQAVENVKPTLELRRVRKGGTTYQVPAIVNQKRQERLAIKWIIESAEKRKKKNKNSFSDCLVSEILEAFNKTGQPRQRRDEQLKIAEFNRAYTRYRWW
jgi:small subunit ribosomal protein S7